ncbi:MAG: glycosyltransferase [Candidatus Micrarchaeia archaeon]
MGGNNIVFSIVIPALNEERYLPLALDGVKRQKVPHETIVVDGGSTDRTVKIAKAFGARVILEKKKGAAPARNAGAKIARGKYLLFLDADTVPSDSLLESYVEAFKRKEVIAATGPILPLEKTAKRIYLGYKFVSVYFVKLSWLFNRPTINGMNFAVKKGTFEKVGGFNEKYVTYEDWDLSHRLAKYGKFAFVNEAIVYSSARRVLKWGLLKFVRYHIGNMLRYTFTKKPKSEYEVVR